MNENENVNDPLLFRDLSLILSCFTLQSGVGRSPGVRVGQETVSS